MPNPKSQIPRLKPASSCGNLTKIGSKTNLSAKSTKDISHSQGRMDQILNRNSMINAPVPVTHRRMFTHYQRTQPPWAIDESLNPFSRETNFEKPKRIHSDHAVQTLITPELMFCRVDSPPLSIDNTIDDDNESVYKTEIQEFVSPQQKKISAGIQTDLHEEEFSHEPNNNRLKILPSRKVTPSNLEKRSVVPLKELKRNNQKNNLTYRVSTKSLAAKEPVDFERMFDDNEKINYHTDDEIQSRIDYWLKKKVILENDVSNKRNNDLPDSGKPQFRNQITFTPRYTGSQSSINGFSRSQFQSLPTPQTIEAIIFQSDSDSERDNIVSSRSLETRSPSFKSHFTIQGNFAQKSKSPMQNDIASNKSIKCDVCNENIQNGSQMNFNNICCHKECFICFWCKKKLSLENYKINSEKLCCPLHFRLLGN